MIAATPSNQLLRPESSARLAFLIICCLVIVTNIIISPERFFDFDAYLTLTDAAFFFPESNFLTFEVGSTLLLVGLRHMAGDTILSVTIAHFIIAILCLAFVWYLKRRGLASWQAILFFFAMYGALLAFVTIRGTPAYLLVALAAMRANEGRNSALVLLGIAFLFHVSVVIAAPAVMFCWLQNRFQLFQITSRALGVAVAAVVLYAALFILFGNFLTNLLLDIVYSVPFLSKYSVHTASFDPVTSTELQSRTDNLWHYIYAAAVTAFIAVFLFIKDERAQRFRGYVLVSFFIFLFCQFSPAMAYRQSIYWMIPAIFIFPWWRIVSGLGFCAIFLMLCAGLFYVNLGMVYS